MSNDPERKAAFEAIFSDPVISLYQSDSIWKAISNVPLSDDARQKLAELLAALNQATKATLPFSKTK